MSAQPESLRTALPPEVATTTGRELFVPGALFHSFDRFPQRRGRSGWVGRRVNSAPNVDRLLSILQIGLIAPTNSRQAIPDFEISAPSSPVPYHGAIFLHRYDETLSRAYLPSAPDKIHLFIDPDLPVKTQAEMGDEWPQLSRDEVYSLEPIPPEHFRGLILPEAYAREQSVRQALAVGQLAVMLT